LYLFFYESLPNALRESMVKQLLTFNRSKDIPPGKPKFPLINPDEIDYPNQLNLFVGAKSGLLFNSLNIDGDMLVWMQVPVVNCEKMSGYHKLKEIVSAFEVVNDCAERAIKMITDFKDATINVEEQEFLLQVVEEYRKRFDVNSKYSLGKTIKVYLLHCRKIQSQIIIFMAQVFNVIIFAKFYTPILDYTIINHILSVGLKIFD
jgi:hypothetical protein